MKLAVAKEHRDFFRKRRSIEFNELLSLQQLEKLNSAIDHALIHRLKITDATLKKTSPESLFLQGRDLWRDDPYIKQIVCQVSLAEIAAELVEFKPLRLAFDQLFVPPSQKHEMVNEEYAQLLQSNDSLQDVSCFHNLLCGLVLCLKGESSEPANTEGDPLIIANIFPKNAGAGVFFSPECPVNWQEINDYPHHRFLMIVYSHPTSVYALNEKDPHTHTLKRLGFVFGDRLSDKYHPIISKN